MDPMGIRMVLLKVPLVSLNKTCFQNPYFSGGTVRGGRLTGHKTSKHQKTRPVDHSEKTAVYQSKLFTVFEKFNHPLEFQG